MRTDHVSKRENCLLAGSTFRARLLARFKISILLWELKDGNFRDS